MKTSCLWVWLFCVNLVGLNTHGWSDEIMPSTPRLGCSSKGLEWSQDIASPWDPASTPLHPASTHMGPSPHPCYHHPFLGFPSPLKYSAALSRDVTHKKELPRKAAPASTGAPSACAVSSSAQHKTRFIPDSYLCHFPPCARNAISSSQLGCLTLTNSRRLSLTWFPTLQHTGLGHFIWCSLETFWQLHPHIVLKWSIWSADCTAP